MLAFRHPLQLTKSQNKKIEDSVHTNKVFNLFLVKVAMIFKSFQDWLSHQSDNQTF